MPIQAPHSLNGYQVLARKLIVHVRTSFLIPIFRRLYGTAAARVQLSYLQKLPVGTLGRGVADILRDNHLQLIPHYENHDLKHVLLGYAMTPRGRAKTQGLYARQRRLVHHLRWVFAAGRAHTRGVARPAATLPAGPPHPVHRGLDSTRIRRPVYGRPASADWPTHPRNVSTACLTTQPSGH